MSHGSKLENNLLCQQNGTDSQSTDDWLAIKTNKYKTTELVNIVSLSVEMEKISIVTREHNRVVTDDIDTKQWYGIYTVEQLYLIHQHFCQINSDLDKYYPNQLKPIKGYLSTYFNNNLSQTICIEKANDQVIDLQDNFLCNSIKDYLKKCIEFIGVNLFVDILFNDLNSNDYFEIYSDFNLKRLQDDIDTAKELFGKIRTKEDKKKRIQKIDLSNEDFIWEFKRTLRNILLFYSQEDRLISQMLLLYAEYYNNLLKPLIDSNELAKKNLAKYEKKLASQLKTNKFLTDQTNTDALKELEEMVQKTQKEITDLSNDIDKLFIQYKQNIMDLYVSMQENIKLDKFQFYLPKNNAYYCFFETIVKNRLSRNENEISEKRVQILKIQLGLIEKKVESLVDNQKNSSQSRDLKIKIIKQKLKIYNEEEFMLKKSLNEIKNDKNDSVSSDVYNLAKNLGQQYLDELNEKFKIDTNIFLIEKKEELDCLVESSESDDDYLSEDTKFFDAYETPDKLNEEANKEKNERVRKINEIKRKILNIGSKKSSLRLALKKLEESEHLEETPEKPAEPAVKTFAIRREEDKIQKEMCMENRNKALLRLKEYKMKKMKDSSNYSMTSINSISKISETEKPAKKPYVPKSKQRILPPNLNQKVKIFKKEEKTSGCSNDEVTSNAPIPPPPPPPLDFLPTNSIKPPAPPPLPPNISNAPLPPPPLPSDISKAPLPPPPPPLDLLSSNSTKPSPPQPPLLIPSLSEKPAKLKEISKHNERPKENTKIEFDINEIKNFKFKKSAKSPPKKEKITLNQFNSWDTLMNEIRTNGGRRLKNITNEASDQKTKCDLDLPLKTKLELDLTSILSERSKFFNLDDEEGSESDASWDN